MRVRDVMSMDVKCISQDATLKEAATKMLICNVGALPVIDGDKLVGIITDRDIAIRAVAAGKDPERVTVAEIMTPDLVVCYDHELVTAAVEDMCEFQVRRLVVLDHNEELVGIISLSDVARETGEEEAAGDVLAEVSEAEHAGEPSSTNRGESSSGRSRATSGHSRNPAPYGVRLAKKKGSIRLTPIPAKTGR